MTTKATGKMRPGSCGCHLVPVNDEEEPCDLCSEATETFNGVGWRIVRCPTHDSGAELVEALREQSAALNQILEWFDNEVSAGRIGDKSEDSRIVAGELAYSKARALLARLYILEHHFARMRSKRAAIKGEEK